MKIIPTMIDINIVTVIDVLYTRFLSEIGKYRIIEKSTPTLDNKTAKHIDEYKADAIPTSDEEYSLAARIQKTNPNTALDKDVARM